MRRYIITLIPVIILILFSLLDALGQTSKDLDRLYKQGQDLYKKAGSRADIEKAVQKFEQALVISRKLGEEKEESNCLNEIGNAYHYWGQYAKALDYYEKSLEIRQKVGDVKGEGVTLNEIGSIYSTLGKYTKALEYYEKSLEIRQKMGDVKGKGVTLHNIGNVYNTQGQYDKALEYYENSLEFTRKDSEVKCVTLNSIGSIYHSWGQYSKALDYYEKSLEIVRRVGDERGEGVNLNSVGEVYNSWGQYSKALEYYEKSLEIFVKLGIVLGEGMALSNIGGMYYSWGQYAKALEYYEKSLEIRRKVGDVKGEAASLANIGSVFRNTGKPQVALSYYKKALEISQSTGVHAESIRSLVGHVYLDMGQIEEAEPFIRASEQEAALGRLHLMKSDYSEALKHYEKLLKKAEENRGTDNLFIAYTGLGRVFEAKEDYSKAAEYYEKAVNTVEDARSAVPPSERKDFLTANIGGFSRSDSGEGLARARMKINKASGSIDSSTEKCSFKIDISEKYPDVGCKDVTDMNTFLNGLFVDDSGESFNKMVRELVSSKKCDFLITGDRVTAIKKDQKGLILLKRHKDDLELWSFFKSNCPSDCSVCIEQESGRAVQ